MRHRTSPNSCSFQLTQSRNRATRVRPRNCGGESSPTDPGTFFSHTPTIMSLIVHVPSKASKSKQHTLQLPRFGKDVDVEAFLVRDPCLIQSGRRFHVFSGTLRASKSKSSPPIRVVCKLSYTSAGRDRLLRESVIYDHLKSLQGKVVPRCYGYFEDTNIAGCLVLEHAGEALTTCFENLDDELK